MKIIIATQEINPGRVFQKHPFLRNGYSSEQKEIPEEIFIGEVEFESGPTTFQEILEDYFGNGPIIRSGQVSEQGESCVFPNELIHRGATGVLK